MANEQNLRRWTEEEMARGRKSPKPQNARALKAIGHMQVILLKTFSGNVEETTEQGVTLRGIKPAELAALATAWDKLEDRRWVLRGHGKPKPVQATNDPGRQPERKPEDCEDNPASGTIPMPKPSAEPTSEAKMG